MPKNQILQWPKRPRRNDTAIARRHIWLSKCKRYRVLRSHILYGNGLLPDVYYAQRFDPVLVQWDIIDFPTSGRHRTKKSAMKHCETDSKSRAH